MSAIIPISRESGQVGRFSHATGMELTKLAKETIEEWGKDDISRLAAALSYYTLFSMIPLLLLLTLLTGFLVGETTAQHSLEAELKSLLGPTAASFFGDLVKESQNKDEGGIAGLLNFGVLIFAATGLFTQLQESVDHIWGVRRSSKLGIVAVIKERWLSFSVVLGMGFLLIITLTVSAMISAATIAFGSQAELTAALVELINQIVSLAVLTTLFAFIYRFLPHLELAWRDVWTGAVLTAVLFAAGKGLIGLYLGKAAITSSFGAAGSVVVLLVWSYYSSHIFLLGAELTQVIAKRRGTTLSAKAGFELVQKA